MTGKPRGTPNRVSFVFQDLREPAESRDKSDQRATLRFEG
jgi:hypothetical protein